MTPKEPSKVFVVIVLIFCIIVFINVWGRTHHEVIKIHDGVNVIPDGEYTPHRCEDKTSICLEVNQSSTENISGGWVQVGTPCNPPKEGCEIFYPDKIYRKIGTVSPSSISLKTQLITWDKSKITSPNVFIQILRKTQNNPASYEIVQTISMLAPNTGRYVTKPFNFEHTKNLYIEIGCKPTLVECHAIQIPLKDNETTNY